MGHPVGMTSDASSSLSAEQAAQALAEVQKGRDAAARRLPTPWWYHPLLGLVLAMIVSSFALPATERTVVLGLAIAAELALLWLYRRLTGVWLNTLSIDGMRGPAAVMCGMAVALLLLALALELWWEVRGGAVAVGVVVGVGYVVFWRWVERRLAEVWRQAP